MDDVVPVILAFGEVVFPCRSSLERAVAGAGGHALRQMSLWYAEAGQLVRWAGEREVKRPSLVASIFSWLMRH